MNASFTKNLSSALTLYFHLHWGKEDVRKEGKRKKTYMAV
jgi:hypothetical protein